MSNIYIMSDIHGLYDRYEAMLKKIDLKEDDRLYVLGDVIDRGPDSFKILQDIMDRENVEMFLGNHEHMMLTYLDGLDEESWFFAANGGRETYQKLMDLDEEQREAFVSFIRNRTTVVRNLEIEGHRYILSHTGVMVDGIDRFTKDYEGRLMEIQDFVWNMFPYSLEMLSCHETIEEPITLISGHIISRRLSGKDEVFVHDFGNGYVWYNIDCGCAMGSGLGKLSCLKINEQGEIAEIFYVE
ncbi:MAG: fructose-bisphosphatase class III [Erysipelotrichaceae bacterium]|nr:fructose-bisphosphatase class III [Erysipelotrichaceae bacterium]